MELETLILGIFIGFFLLLILAYWYIKYEIKNILMDMTNLLKSLGPNINPPSPPIAPVSNKFPSTAHENIIINHKNPYLNK